MVAYGKCKCGLNPGSETALFTAACVDSFCLESAGI